MAAKKRLVAILAIIITVVLSGCITDGDNGGGDSEPQINSYDTIILETSDIDQQTIDDLRMQLDAMRDLGIDPDGKVALVRFYGVIGEEDLGTFRDVMASIGDNDQISAVVLWVDTPGGGVGSTAALYNEILWLRAKKPVVLYSSEMLASGGYYIACAADLVVADADALIGNISTIYVHTDASQYYSDFGLKITVIKTGEYKDIGADWRSLTDEEYQWMLDMTYDAYNRFVHVVAQGRGLTNQEALELSDGKIWLATEAMDLGLIDAVGTLQTAIDAAEGLAKLEKAEIVSFEMWEEGSMKYSGYHSALRYQWDETIDFGDLS